MLKLLIERLNLKSIPFKILPLLRPNISSPSVRVLVQGKKGKTSIFVDTILWTILLMFVSPAKQSCFVLNAFLERKNMLVIRLRILEEEFKSLKSN